MCLAPTARGMADAEWRGKQSATARRRRSTAAATAGNRSAVSFSDERAEWIGAVTKTAEMVELLLDALDRLRL